MKDSLNHVFVTRTKRTVNWTSLFNTIFFMTKLFRDHHYPDPRDGEKPRWWSTYLMFETMIQLESVSHTSCLPQELYPGC